MPASAAPSLAHRATAVDHAPSADDARAHSCTAGIIAGDPDALADLYMWWQPMMVAWARKATHMDAALCDDIVHDALLKVIARAEPIATAATLGAWLRAVVLNTARDTLRAEARRARRDATPRLSAAVSDAPSPLAAADIAETVASIESELAALTRDHRELLDARFRFGWTLHHTARVLGVKPGLVDGRIRRSLKSIRASIDPDSSAPPSIAPGGES